MSACSLHDTTRPNAGARANANADPRAPARVRARGIAPVTIAAAVAVALSMASLAAPGLAGAAPGRAAGRTRSLVCKGGASSCRAVVSVAGGASREKLRIALSDTDLKLTGVVAKPKTIKGAYQLYGGKYSLGGSLYTVMLNAVRAIPKGATLTFSFAAPRA
ncbi:MAG TPA: hypothetical protein VMB51_12325 [Solirubrobacteraceae bacterium]|nr:hypothetical protein [Solirubrobacteraceae bacterium]